MLSLHTLTLSLLALSLIPPTASTTTADRSHLPRTLVTTDLEQDDLASLIRYLLYTNELDTQGLIYTSSRYHWSGSGNGSLFFLPDREYSSPQWTFRWTGTRTIQDKVLTEYANIYPNLINHDPFYPSPDELRSLVKIGNIDFEGEMDHDTEGSDLIKDLLLDDNPRVLYLQAWGGTNTIARALKSIEEKNASMKESVSRKAVILASGFQDETYAEYISLHWPDLRVENFQAGYATWGYNCNKGKGNTRGVSVGAQKYFTGAWIHENIETGPYGSLYRSWLDNQAMPGDPLDVFGNLSWYADTAQTCSPLDAYDFLSEGDNVVFNPLLKTGLEDPGNPRLGGWGGRSVQNSSDPELWVLVDEERASNGSVVAGYTTDRWMDAVQNDFGARMQWTLTANYSRANHPPSVEIRNGSLVRAEAGKSVTLVGDVSDPDGDTVKTSWWQFFEEGSYNGTVRLVEGNSSVEVMVPSDASGKNISVILQGTDDGDFPLTRYGRVFIQVE